MTASDPRRIVEEHMAAGRLEQAAAAIDDLLATDPDNARNWATASWVRRSGVSADAGLEAARRAIELNPGYAQGHRMAAAALESLGRYREARGAANDAIALDPDSWRTHAMRAQIDVTAGEVDGVTVRAARRAADLMPERAGAHRLLGAVLQRTGDERGMARSFERAVALGDKDVTLRLHIGLDQLRRSRLNRATGNITAVLAAVPTHVQARAALLRIVALWLLPVEGLLFVAAVVGLTTEGERVAITDPLQRPFAVVTVPPDVVRTVPVDDGPPSFDVSHHPLSVTLLAAALVVLVLGVGWNLCRALGAAGRGMVRRELRAAPTVLLSLVVPLVGAALFVVAAIVGGPPARTLMIVILCLQFGVAAVVVVGQRLSGGRAGRRQRLG